MLTQIVARFPRRFHMTGELLILCLLHRKHHFLAGSLFGKLSLMADRVHRIKRYRIGNQHGKQQEETG